MKHLNYKIIKQLILTGFLVAISLIRCKNFSTENLRCDHQVSSPSSSSIRVRKFKNIQDIVNDSTSTLWYNPGMFWGLYLFPNKVEFHFNPSCSYWFPARLEGHKVSFIWALNPECGFNRGLDTIFANVTNPGIGDKFGEIELINDSTLHIEYSYPEFVKKINEAESTSIDSLFPTMFHIDKFFEK